MVVGYVALIATIFGVGALVAYRARRETHAEEVQIVQGVRRVCKLATVEVSLADRFMALIHTGTLHAQGSFAAATKYWESMGGTADLIGIAMFGVLCFLLVRAARQKLEV